MVFHIGVRIIGSENGLCWKAHTVPHHMVDVGKEEERAGEQGVPADWLSAVKVLLQHGVVEQPWEPDWGWAQQC